MANRRAAAVLRPEIGPQAVFRNVSSTVFLRATGLSTCAGGQPVKTALKTSGQTCYSPITSPNISCASRFFLSNA